MGQKFGIEKISKRAEQRRGCMRVLRSGKHRLAGIPRGIALLSAALGRTTRSG